MGKIIFTILLSKNCLSKPMFYAGISVSKPEEARLVEENQRLRVEIEKLRVKLVLAEVKNGGKHMCRYANFFIVKWASM